MAAARLIVILKRAVQPDGHPRFDYVLRADVPVARQPFVADAIAAAPILYFSPFRPISPDTDPDAAGIASGAIMETFGSLIVDPALTLAEVQGILQRLQLDFQTATTADKTYLRYGSFFNGTAWTGQGAS